MSNIYLGLVHYPIYNRRNEVITTSVTNYDIHDIARTARTYDVERYFIVHPQESQARLVREVLDYWQNGLGAQYHSDRKEAFKNLRLANDIEAARQEIIKLENKEPLIVTTDAKPHSNTVSYKQARRLIQTEERPWLVLFGTGWGIEAETVSRFDYILEPIYGVSDYNHLPVRAAVAIILDRLCGENWWL